MKSVVYKHLIPFKEVFTINLKEGSKVVRIDVDQGNPYMWVLTPLDEDLKVVKYHFKSSKTGGVIEHDSELVFLDTYAIFIQMELIKLCVESICFQIKTLIYSVESFNKLVESGSVLLPCP